MKVSKGLIKDLLIACLVFFPSLVPIPLLFHLGLIIFVLPAHVRMNYSIGLLILIPLLSLCNQVLNIDIFLTENLGIKEIVPYSVFMIISYFFALKVSLRALYFVVYLVVVEVFIGMLEYFAGVRSFLPGVREAVSGQNPFGFKGLLYYSRVSGLSSNSSVLAMKIMVSLMLLYYLKPRSKKEGFFLYGFLGIGLVITFTRSVYLALAIFIFLIYYQRIKKAIFRVLGGKLKLFYFIFTAIVLGGIAFLTTKVDLLLKQLNRGMKTTDLSSRDKVFDRYFEFLSENIWLGNGSYKLWVTIDGKVFHAHNVFVQVLTTNGVIIGVLYFIFIIINLNRKNVNYIIPILIISLFQYAIFWGISFVDLIFFFFLLMAHNKKTKRSFG